MRIGLNFGGPSRQGFDDTLSRFSKAEADGFSTYWASSAGYDSIIMLALAGRVTKTIELGTAVVPTYPRHPTALAQQALTVQAVSGNRFVLGIGLSHRVSIEGRLGLDYSKPILHMREYLTVLTGALSGQPVRFAGKLFNVNTQVQVPGAKPPLVVVAALGPQMLKLAGTLANGTITWMGGPRYLETTAVPLIAKAARDAGRVSPRIIAGFPVAVTNKPDAALATVAQTFANYASLPAYRKALALGLANPLVPFYLATLESQSAAGNLDEALRWAQTAVAGDATSAQGQYLLGTLLKRSKRNDEARHCLEKAVSLQPSLAEAHFLLAQLYAESGDTARAEAERRESERWHREVNQISTDREAIQKLLIRVVPAGP